LKHIFTEQAHLVSIENLPGVPYPS